MKNITRQETAPQGQTIIIKEKRSGCGRGCLLLVLIAVAVMGYSIYTGLEHADRARERMTAREAAMTPEQKAAREIEKPTADNVKYLFAKALKDSLRDPDSYKPGEYRYHDHPQGYAYFHDYRAKNGFGGYAKEVCGFLCATNSGKRVWTFYNQDAVPDLLKACGVK